ncbi:MAG: hypothetical protein JJE04_26185 [Acidobacteriia bacterium]|nr:hypothetical protein [Terriglobia bacterium]
MTRHAKKSLIASNATYSRNQSAHCASFGISKTNRVVQNLLPKPLFQGGLPALVKATEIIALAKRTTKQFHSLALSLIAVTQSRSTCNNAPQPPGCRKDSLEGALREKEIA